MTLVFSCEFPEMFKNIFSIEQFRMAATALKKFSVYELSLYFFLKSGKDFICLITIFSAIILKNVR